MRLQARNVAVVGGVLVLAVVLSGCGDSGDGGVGEGKSPATVSVMPSAWGEFSPEPVPESTVRKPVGEDAEQERAVLKVYDRMLTAEAKAYRTASASGTGVERYATYKALAAIRDGVDNLKDSGAVVTGEVGHDARVTRLDLEAKVPTATLSDCVDLSRYRAVKAGKEVPLPTEQPLRYVMTVSAERWDGRWMITRIATDGPEC